ncbi:hypothetical protein COW46_02065 [Candidatus Gracilibacteria bacterium CG17_big_fil_post_rev_8_21_14_2_50_48_13]|nr:MAG: hypothetical protein COW46_02065 [Candidatus Gracilibacteria bacterium CG17_big_fil_post_rev_8_21_14_2_50_48_13]
MIPLEALRSGSYYAFLLTGGIFLVSSLLTAGELQAGNSHFLHSMMLFGSVLSLLLTISFSLALLAHEKQSNKGTIVLGASLLISTMIAAALFLL